VFERSASGAPAGSQDSCETKAVGKDGKPLAGAAKTSFLKKCEAGTQGCAPAYRHSGRAFPEMHRGRRAAAAAQSRLKR
jgi:hypothetical protein